MYGLRGSFLESSSLATLELHTRMTEDSTA